MHGQKVKSLAPCSPTPAIRPVPSCPVHAGSHRIMHGQKVKSVVSLLTQNKLQRHNGPGFMPLAVIVDDRTEVGGVGSRGLGCIGVKGVRT